MSRQIRSLGLSGNGCPDGSSGTRVRLMAMIEQRPSPLRAAVSRALTGRKVACAGGLVTLLLVLVFGTDSLLFWFTQNYGELLIPSSLGVPVLLPGLRFTRFAQESWTALGCEDFAALLLVG